MSSDTQARFSIHTKARIRRRYKNRCAICFQRLTSSGSQCAHLIDASKCGATQLATAVALKIIPRDYKRSSVENGIVLCPTCHLAFFTSEHVVLSPAPQVLQYIIKYLSDTDLAHRKPLHKIFRSLEGRHADLLPDAQCVLPFLGLYTLVILLPDELDELQIIAHHFPALSIRAGDKFVPAPPDTLPDAPGAARIFDPLDTDLPDALSSGTESQTQSTSTSVGVGTHHPIPLSPHHAEFAHQRYWRLPVRPEVMLTMLLERVRHVAGAGCDEINHAHVIGGILMINKAGVEVNIRGLPIPSESGSSSSRRRSAPEEEEGEGHTDTEEPPRKVTRCSTRRQAKEADGTVVDKGKKNRRKGTPAPRTSTANPGPRPRKTKRLKI